MFKFDFDTTKEINNLFLELTEKRARLNTLYCRKNISVNKMQLNDQERINKETVLNLTRQKYKNYINLLNSFDELPAADRTFISEEYQTTSDEMERLLIEMATIDAELLEIKGNCGVISTIIEEIDSDILKIRKSFDDINHTLTTLRKTRKESINANARKTPEYENAKKRASYYLVEDKPADPADPAKESTQSNTDSVEDHNDAFNMGFPESHM